MTLLHAAGLHLSFGSRTVFDDLTLTIEEGERVGLVGVNGSGKSSLMKLLARVSLPDRGELQLRRGATVTYLPQEPEFPPDATVASELEVARAPLKRRHRRPRGALGAAGHGGGGPGPRQAPGRAGGPLRPGGAPGRLGHRPRGPPAPRPARGQGLGPAGGRALRRDAQAGGHRAGAALPARPAAARRADQPPRRRHGRLAGGGAGRARRRAPAGDPRPVLPRRPGRPDRRDHAGRRRDQLPGQLRDLPRAEAGGRGGGRPVAAQARPLDRPGGGLAAARPGGAAHQVEGAHRPGAEAHGREGLHPPQGGRLPGGGAAAPLGQGAGGRGRGEAVRRADGARRPRPQAGRPASGSGWWGRTASARPPA